MSSIRSKQADIKRELGGRQERSTQGGKRSEASKWKASGQPRLWTLLLQWLCGLFKPQVAAYAILKKSPVGWVIAVHFWRQNSIEHWSVGNTLGLTLLTRTLTTLCAS